LKYDKIYAKKSLGQNFITDKNFLSKLSSLIKTNSKLTIIEIGPGKGALTKELIKKKIKNIIVVEKDDELIPYLDDIKSKFNILEIFHHDALLIDYDKFIKKDSIIVGNLPFNISTELLLKWIFLRQWPPNYKKMYLMFQKEVAERIIAEPGTKKYGRLSVITQARCKVKKLLIAKSNIFNPIPKVDGMIIEFTPHNRFMNNNIKILEKIVKLAFGQRRKKIKTTLSEYRFKLTQLKIDENLRAENISVSQYCRLAETMK
jgi:16S rRNA (adenine1518-N6/adenine1519-N6)-dimethyltransferase